MKKLIIVLLVLSVQLLTACGTVTEEGVLFKTADPGLNIGFRWLVTPEPVGIDEPDPFPVEPCEVLKGNINSSGEKIVHSPGQANYNQVKINEAAGEMFFCSLEAAIEAGWRPAQR